MLAGLGMVVGNVFGGYLADKVSPAKASLALLLTMVVTLVVVHFFSFNPFISLALTFITGAISFALASPIQMLMITSAKNSEMLAASASQASFNIGNALGAFFGGIPLVYHYDYTWPALVGAAMALIGGLFAFWLIKSHHTVKASAKAQPIIELAN